MKKTRATPLLSILPLAACLLLMGCAWLEGIGAPPPPAGGDRSFQITFDQSPNIATRRIYSKGFPIGRVMGESLDAGNRVAVEILIHEKYVPLISEHAAFYVKSDRIIYEALEEGGEPAPAGAALPGFNTANEFFWYKTKRGVGGL